MSTQQKDKSFIVRMTRAEHARLKAQAEAEHRSMQEVVRLAVNDRVASAERPARVEAMIAQSRQQWSQAFDALSQR